MLCLRPITLTTFAALDITLKKNLKMIYGIVLMFAGVLAVYPVFGRGAKSPHFQNVQKYGGFAVAALGIWAITDSILKAGSLCGQAVPRFTQLVSALALATIGILLTFRPRLPVLMAPFLITMGFIAFGLGICQIIIAAIWA